jgi:3-hydroxyacyl-CoA dehydrogenase
VTYERQLFGDLMSGSQSAAQRYYFFAERQVAKIPDIPAETPLLDIKKVGIIGAGTMGGGHHHELRQCRAFPSHWWSQAGVPGSRFGHHQKNYDITASKGKMTAEDVEKRMGLIKGTVAHGRSGGCGPGDRSGLRKYGSEEGDLHASWMPSVKKMPSWPPTPPIWM